jgi:hypothetical protein
MLRFYDFYCLRGLRKGGNLTQYLPRSGFLSYGGSRQPIALTYHYDPQHPTNPITTATACDGWGRIVQVKKDLGVEGEEKSSVSGRADYDSYGRVVQQYDPWVESSDSIGDYTSRQTPLRTTNHYDILDRTVACSTYCGNSTLVTSSTYSIASVGGQRRFRTKVIDAKGNTSYTYKDPRGLAVRTEDANGGVTLGEFYKLIY